MKRLWIDLFFYLALFALLAACKGKSSENFIIPGFVNPVGGAEQGSNQPELSKPENQPGIPEEKLCKKSKVFNPDPEGQPFDLEQMRFSIRGKYQLIEVQVHRTIRRANGTIARSSSLSLPFGAGRSVPATCVREATPSDAPATDDFAPVPESLNFPAAEEEDSLEWQNRVEYSPALDVNLNFPRAHKKGEDRSFAAWIGDFPEDMPPAFLLWLDGSLEMRVHGQHEGVETDFFLLFAPVQ